MNTQFDVIGIGMSTVDNLFLVPMAPAFGQKFRAADYKRQGGGPVATALVTLARLGAMVSFIGKIGDDTEGNFIKAEFLKEGVDISHLITEPGAQSLVVLVLVDQNSGERCFTPRPETCAPLSPDELDKAFITSGKVLHLDNPDEASITAAQWAQDAGMQVVYDAGWYDEHAKELLSLTDVAIVSELFAASLIPKMSAATVTQRLCEMGPEIAIVTLGEQGCVVCDSTGIQKFPAFPVEVIDTTGAGDAFHGAFIYGMLQNWEVQKIVEFASAIARLNTTLLIS